MWQRILGFVFKHLRKNCDDITIIATRSKGGTFYVLDFKMLEHALYASMEARRARLG